MTSLKMHHVLWVVCLLPLVLLSIVPAAADTIYDIQYTTAADGASPLADTTVASFTGGIVTHKWAGGAGKLTLYDPNYSTGWGGIQLKDFDYAMFDDVSVGDWVSFENVFVEEFRGNTILQYDPTEYGSTYNVESTGNAVPTGLIVTLDEIAAPVEGPVGEWYVADRSAEKYEAMWLRVEDVTVTEMNLGYKADNYNVNHNPDAWVSDYMNADRVGDYHPTVAIGQHYAGITGILEQYVPRDGTSDYYQLLTTSGGDLVVPEPGSILLGLLGAAGMAVVRRRRKSA